MTVRSAERTQFLTDLYTTALEGGISYWAEIHAYEWQNEARATISEKDTPSEVREITIDTIARGVDLIVTSTPNTPESRAESPNALAPGAIRFLSSGTRARIDEASRANDAGQLDARDADVIVQVALFGEVTYG